jgi:hypothetical protein
VGESTFKEIAIDAIKNKAVGTYSSAQTSEALRAALIEMNGGSTKLNYRKFYKGTALFQAVEDLISVIIEEGISKDNPLFNLVEYKNIAAGDVNDFTTSGNAQFIVAEAAAGIQGVRRQRISGGETVSVKTSVKIVRVYENLGRLLAGRIAFDQFVDGVSKAFNLQIDEDAYEAINAISATTAGLDSTYVYTGSYDEDALVALIDHVEAATGKAARILGTKAALRKIVTAVQSAEARADLYKLGYYGKFNGTDIIQLRQAHKAGTQNFALNDSKLFIIAGDDKPIKMVNAGEGLMIEREATINADLTQEYVYLQEYGTGVIIAEKIGIYNI